MFRGPLAATSRTTRSEADPVTTDDASPPSRDEERSPPAGDVDIPDVPPPTPFDHPLFIPIVCFGFTLYFGYDGWFNPEIESIQFNRVVFGLLVLLTIYTTWQDVQFGKKSKD
jgi:hypothetical protein